ncbi:MAG: hypothetical protein ACUVWO_05580 [Thermodesulfobacteriota bacterium]
MREGKKLTLIDVPYPKGPVVLEPLVAHQLMLDIRESKPRAVRGVRKQNMKDISLRGKLHNRLRA